MNEDLNREFKREEAEEALKQMSSRTDGFGVGFCDNIGA